MKICWIGLDLFDTGGISTYSRYIVRALDELNNENFKLTTIINLSFTKNRINFDLSYSIRVITFNYKNLNNRLLALVKSIKDIYKSDLIILNHSSLFAFATIAFLLRKKVIVFGYNIDIISVKGFRKHVLINFVDEVIVDCTYTQKILKDKFNIQSKLLFDPIEKVVPPKKENTLSEYTSENCMQLITIAVLRMSQNKGHRLVFKALKELKNLHIKYLVIGDGPDYFNLKSIVEKYEINDLVEFKGYVSEKEKDQFMEIADISILISKSGRYGEGLPLGLIEAGAYGNAIIGGNEDGTVDAVDKDKPNGFLINPYSVQDLVKIIKRYYFNRDLLESHKQNSINYCNDNFSYHIFRNKLRNYLDQLT